MWYVLLSGYERNVFQGMLTINVVLRAGGGCGGCGGCNIVCCGPRPACKAPRNTDTEAMHWLDKKNVVHSVKKGELIPHYSKIAQVYTNKKWEVFTPASDMKAAQDACSCVEAVRSFFLSPLRDCFGLCFFKVCLVASKFFFPFYSTYSCLFLRTLNTFYVPASHGS